jgi:hypothetical protein
MRCVVCVGIVALLALPFNLYSQSVEDLLARIEKLEKRMAELEGTKQEEPKPLAAVPHDHDQVPQPGEAAQPQYPALHIAGFSDINFSGNDQKMVPKGFTEGQFTLHLISPLSPRVTYFGELTLSARADAGMGPAGTPPATGFNPEVERSIIRFYQSDK